MRRSTRSKLRMPLFATLAMPLLIACGPSSDGIDASERTYVIKFPHVVAPSTPKGQAAARFKELAEAQKK